MDLNGNHRQLPDILMLKKFYSPDDSNFYPPGKSLEFQAHLFSNLSLGEGMPGKVGGGARKEENQKQNGQAQGSRQGRGRSRA